MYNKLKTNGTLLAWFGGHIISSRCATYPIQRLGRHSIIILARLISRRHVANSMDVF